MDDRGRRRDGGASFAVALLDAKVKKRGGKPNFALTKNSQCTCPSAISPTPSVFWQYPLETFTGVVDLIRGAVFFVQR